MRYVVLDGPRLIYPRNPSNRGWSWGRDRAPGQGFRLIAEPKDPRIRVVCGGSWHYVPSVLRSAIRDGGQPGGCGSSLGFRLIAESKS